MNKFFLITIAILIFLIVGGYVYYSNKTMNLENSISMLQDDLTDNLFSTPELINNIPATISKQDGVISPKIIYRDTGTFKKVPFIEYDTIVEPFDTLGFLKDYLSIKIFEDSISSQDVDIKVTDTLQKNSIFARGWKVKNNRSEEFYKRRMIYTGGTSGFNSQFYIGPSIQYIDKKNNLFGGAYLFSPDGNKTILFNYSKKISFKK